MKTYYDSGYFLMGLGLALFVASAVLGVGSASCISMDGWFDAIEKSDRQIRRQAKSNINFAAFPFRISNRTARSGPVVFITLG